MLIKSFDHPLLWETKTPLFEYDSMPPIPYWKIKCDGSTEGGRVIDMPDNDKVRSNLGITSMEESVSYNYQFIYNPNEIILCVSRSADWGLKVINPRYDARAQIIFRDCMGNDTTVVIEYYASKVIIRPDFSSLGIVKLGATASRDLWLVNRTFDGPSVVERLELKDKDKGFSITGITLPVTIPPGDSVKFTVKFSADEEGKFIDSIGIGNDCVFYNLAHVEANVMQSIINVSDAYFNDLPIRKSDTMAVDITNNGNVDLVITGYKGPANPAYKTNLPDINKMNPLIIKPNGPSYKFNVEFHPLLEENYRDSIVFFSDARKIDSVAVLNGRGIQPGMISTSFDWGRRRIGNEYTTGNQGIKIENTSDGEVTIYGFATPVNNGGSVFEFDESLLNNATIPPGESIFVPVKFKPVAVGKYELVIVYDNSINSQTETRLFGIGVNPILEPSPSFVEFDTSVVDLRRYPITDTVRFKNIDWEYGDTIIIKDLQIIPNGDEISTNINQYGALGFKFDKKALHLPRVLLPGDILEIPVMFVAKAEGDANTGIRTVSDIDTEKTSYIHGYGINEGIRIESSVKERLNTCVGGQDTIIYSIINTGHTVINVTSIKIVDSLNYFHYQEPRDSLGFFLPISGTEKVNVLYKPEKSGLTLGDFIVYNDTKYNSEDHNKLEGVGIQHKRSIRVDLHQENNQVKIGNKFDVSVFLEPGDDIDFINLKELGVEIRYNGGIIKAIPEDIKLGSLLEGRFQINNLSIADAPGIIRLTLDTLDGIPNQKLSGDGELMKIFFSVYLPNSKDSSDKSIIEPIIKPLATKCVDFSDTKTITVEIEQVCLKDIRKINVNSLNYGIGTIKPNPAGADGSEVVYSVGLEGNTQFEILNSEGDLVYKTEIPNQKPGVYNFMIPSSSLGSGVYWLRMISGPFNSIKEFIIIK